MDRTLNRRRLLTHLTSVAGLSPAVGLIPAVGGIAAGGLWGAGLSMNSASGGAAGSDGDEEIRLQPRGFGTPQSPSGVLRVRLEMEIKGNLHLARDPLASRAVDMKLPIVADGVFDYEERAHRIGDRCLAERAYHVAGSDARINRRLVQNRLRDSVRRMIVDRGVAPETIFSPGGHLRRDELELLHSPISSVEVDRWLPTDATRIGRSHDVSLSDAAAVLNLSAVHVSDLTLETVDITDDEVKFEIRGEVEGAAAGVPTTMDVVGKINFDRRQSTTSWLALAIKERRDIGVAEPGFELSSVVKMLRTGVPQPKRLTSVAVRDLSAHIDRIRTAGPGGSIDPNQLVQIDAKEIGVSAMMDRRWRSMSDLAGSAVWRMSQNDRGLAQCDLRELPDLPAGKVMTRDGFIEQVRTTLGSQLREITAADDRQTTSGLRVVSVTAAGEVEGIGIAWSLAHIVDPVTDRRVLATFTLKADELPTFAGCDAQLIETLAFAPDRDDAAGPSITGEGSGESKIPSGMDSTKSTAAMNHSAAEAKIAQKHRNAKKAARSQASGIKSSSDLR